MTIHRFFVAPEAMSGDTFPLPAAISHQVQRVLRLADGDEIVLLDGLGREALCRIEAQARKLRVLSRGGATGEPRHRLVLWQALLKGDSLDRVVQQAAELGVAAVRLVVTRRCVVRELSPRRLERLRTIAREAAEQSERGIVPEVAEPVGLSEALHPGAVLLHERSDGDAPRLGSLRPPSALIVGPEGGFHPDEVAAARAAGVTFASLGPRILRSESVAIAGAAVVLSRSGDFA